MCVCVFRMQNAEILMLIRIVAKASNGQQLWLLREGAGQRPQRGQLLVTYDLHILFLLLLCFHTYGIFSFFFWWFGFRPKGRILYFKLEFCRILQNVAKFGRIWHNLVKFARIWQNLAKFGKIWQYLGKLCRIWQTLAKFCRIWILRPGEGVYGGEVEGKIPPLWESTGH